MNETYRRESARHMRTAIREARRQRAGSGLWARFLRMAGGAPVGATFTVSVSPDGADAVREAAAELGYRAVDVRPSGDGATIDLTWTGSGYAAFSSRQRRDLAQGLSRYGIRDVGVTGPRMGVSPLREWWAVATNDADAGPLHAALEHQGYSGCVVVASSQTEAERMIREQWDLPVPCDIVTDSDGPVVHGSGVAPGAKGRAAALLAGVGLGGTLAWRAGWAVQTASGAATAVPAEPLSTYVGALLGVGSLMMMTVLMALVVLRSPMPTKPLTMRRPRTPSRTERILQGLVGFVGGALVGALFLVVLRRQVWQVLCLLVLVAVVTLTIRLLDPPDRRRLRWPTVGGALLAGVVGWAVVADYLFAAGLGVPFGAVRADPVTRAAALALIVVPAAVCALVGGVTFRLMRREERFLAGLLLAMTSGCVLLSATAGLAFLSVEAVRLVDHPSEGFWQHSVSLQRVGGMPSSPASKSPGDVSPIHAVLGEVGERVVLISDPCGRAKQLVVRLAAELSFEPATWQSCTSEASARVR